MNPQDEEIAKFGGLLLRVTGENSTVTLVSPNSSYARKLRRRFYYLLDKLPVEISKLSAQVNFRVVGRQVILEPRIRLTQDLISGVQENASDNSGGLPRSDRLDDPS